MRDIKSQEWGNYNVLLLKLHKNHYIYTDNKV